MEPARWTALVLGMLVGGCGGGGEIAATIQNGSARPGFDGQLEVTFDLELSLDPSAGDSSDCWLFALQVAASDFSFGPFPVAQVSGAAFPITTDPGGHSTARLSFTTSAPPPPNVVPCMAAPPPTTTDLRLTGSVYDELSGKLVPVAGDVAAEAPPDPSGPTPVTSARWSKGFGDGSDQVAADIAVDAAGAPVVVGYMMGSVDFGGGPLDAGSNYAPFLLELDADGNHVASRLLDTVGPQGFVAGPNFVAVDADGNIFVAGTFDGVVDLGGGPLQSSGGTDVFVAKLDPAGNHLWSRSFGGPDTQGLTFMGLDDAGDVALVGHFMSPVDFGGGPLAPLDPGKYDHAFAAMLDGSGEHLWSKAVGSFDGMSGPFIGGVRGDGAVVVGGGFTGVASFVGEPAPAGSSNPTSDLFLLELDPQGELAWSQHPVSPMNEAITSVAVAADGEIAVVVAHDGAVEIGGQYLTEPGTTMVARLGPDGEYLHHADLFTSGGSVTDLAIGPDGHALLSGGLSPGSGLLPGGVTVMGPFDGNGVVFFLELDEAGEFVRAFGQGCASGTPLIGAARTGSSDVVLAGTFSNPVDFGQGPLVSAGAGDVFVVKLTLSE